MLIEKKLRKIIFFFGVIESVRDSIGFVNDFAKENCRFQVSSFRNERQENDKKDNLINSVCPSLRFFLFEPKNLLSCIYRRCWIPLSHISSHKSSEF